MSYISEAKLFSTKARELWDEAAKETDPEKRAEIERAANGYADDACCAWEMAGGDYCEPEHDECDAEDRQW